MDALPASGSRRAPRLRVAVAALLLAAGAARGYETDQFNHRLTALADSREAMNRHVNEALAEVVAEAGPRRDERRIVRAVYRKLGGLHWVDRIERWVMKSPEIARLDTPRHRSIYAGHPLHATRVTKLFGVGATFKLDGVLVGSDKLGHFFSQGRKFWRRWKRHGDEARAAERSAYTERAIFGRLTTGDYSNADLVANYEGHRFYRSLFEDAIAAGKPAILAWNGSHWTLQRPFDWADHVNPYWDEALFPNDYDRWLRPHMRARFATFCADYARDPAAWTIPPEVDAALAARYAMLQLRPAHDLQLPTLCRADGELATP
jgi:hypothetical protein